VKKVLATLLVLQVALPLTAEAVSEKDCKVFSKEIEKIIRENKPVPEKKFDWWKQKRITEGLEKNSLNVVGYYPAK